MPLTICQKTEPRRTALPTRKRSNSGHVEKTPDRTLLSSMISPAQWNELTKWWTGTATRLGVGSPCVSFFMPGSGAVEALSKVLEAEGDLHYVLFVLIRYWVPPILPPMGKERLGKDRAWPIVCDVITAAGIRNADGEPYDPDELKSWWTKQWPRAYALLAPKDAEVQPTEYAYQSDYQWFQTWMSYQVESRQS